MERAAAFTVLEESEPRVCVCGGVMAISGA